MPLLQELVLWRVLPDATDTDLGTRVCLPHLRLLFLLNDDKRSLALWSSLVIPSTCSIRLELEDFDEQDASMVYTLLKYHLSGPNGPTYQRVQFGDTEARTHSTHICMHSTATVEDASAAPLVLERRYVSTYKIDADPMISLSVPSGDLGFLRKVLDLLPREPIRTITLNERAPLSAFSFASLARSLMCRFSQTETIEVQGLAPDCSSLRGELAQAAFTFILDIAPTAQEFAEFGRECYMPRLHTLSVDNIDLHSESRYTEGRQLHEVLTEAFERRLAVGMPLRTLNIRGDRLQDSWRESWSSLVGEVFWNGKRAVTSDYDSDSDDGDISSAASEDEEED
ncbi:hypothetical protein PENSPDRAFT_653532 [Peniophora sp. CONT]|nr:hypothetical protein PENSPDRAFT_653532 [Peniophora sp. CONT]